MGDADPPSEPVVTAVPRRRAGAERRVGGHPAGNRSPREARQQGLHPDRGRVQAHGDPQGPGAGANAEADLSHITNNLYPTPSAQENAGGGIRFQTDQHRPRQNPSNFLSLRGLP